MCLCFVLAAASLMGSRAQPAAAVFASELYLKGPQTAAPASGLPSKGAVVSLLQLFTA